MSFLVITPVTITDAMLTSSSVPEPDTGETAWAVGTTYALAARAYKNHIMYESLIAGNLGNDPALETQNDPDNPPTKWLEVGRTNRWEMFNLTRNAQTVYASPHTVVITPGKRINSLGISGLENVDNVSITVTSGATTVYSNTENLNTRDVTSYYDYCFAPFSTRPSFVKFDLPPYTDAVISVTLSATSGLVKCGAFVIGNSTNIGDVQYGAESDVLNFSRIDRAFDGTIQLLPRRSVPKTIQQVFADKSLVNKIRNLRTALNAVPAVWAGLDQTDDEYFEPLLIFGIYKRFSINLDHPTAIITSLEIEEL